jgi:hypothetical protein
MATRLILNTPVTVEASPKGPEFVRVSIKIQIFGLKIFDVPVLDAQWVVDEAKKLIAVSSVKK